jgi:fibronectin-attachment protein (FAP)
MKRSLPGAAAAAPAMPGQADAAPGALGASGAAAAATAPVGPAAHAPSPAAAPAAAAPARVDTLRTEFEFELPRGYVDEAGTVHRRGAMRLSTARDELLPLRDVRVRENPAYLSVVLLGRVITRLGSLPMVHDGVVENMFASDLAFLQDFYEQINAEGHTLASVTCPNCAEDFEIDLGGSRLGES